VFLQLFPEVGLVFQTHKLIGPTVGQLLQPACKPQNCITNMACWQGLKGYFTLKMGFIFWYTLKKTLLDFFQIKLIKNFTLKITVDSQMTWVIRKSNVYILSLLSLISIAALSLITLDLQL